MTQQEFLDLIPQVLLYIVPGFFVLKIIESYTLRKKLAQMETILWSIFFSFLVELALAFVQWFLNLAKNRISYLNHIFPFQVMQTSFGDTTTIALSLVLSAIIGYLLTKIINSRIGYKIVKMFNFNLEAGEDFWFEAMKSTEGVWAIVYMKNGMVYRGQVSKFSADPNDATKMLVLTHFCTLFKKDEPQGISADVLEEKLEDILKEMKRTNRIKIQSFTTEIPSSPKSNYQVIRDETTNPSAKVVLKYDDILSIELSN